MANSLTLQRAFGTLAPMDQVRSLLAAETSVESISDFAAKVEAARKYDSDTLERRNYWGELAIFSSRRLGELIKEGQEAGTISSKGRPRKMSPEVTISLEDIGVSRNVSSKAQRLASIPAEKIDEYTAAAKKTQDEVSKAGLLRFCVQKHKQEDVSWETQSAGIVTDLSDLVETGIKFGCIYADPPWAYSNKATRAAVGGLSACAYKSTMSVDEICNEPVSELAAERCHLHLWTTNAFLFEARRVLTEWGFEYKSCFVWVKPQMGIGNYWRVSHEFMLLGVRGGLTFADHGLKSWMEIDRTRHSVKPASVRNLVMKASPGPYLEMYGREAPLEGWTVYGNEVAELLV